MEEYGDSQDLIVKETTHQKAKITKQGVALCIIFFSVVFLTFFLVIIGIENREKSTEGYLLLKDITPHLYEFQDIASKHGNSRSIATGFNASLEYVAKKLEGISYFSVSRQEFPIAIFKELEDSILKYNLQSDSDVVYLEKGVHYATLSYSPSAQVNGTVWQIPNFGCEPEDFNFTDIREVEGNIIGIASRGTCTFHQKAMLASTAGLAGLLVANNDAGLFYGTLGSTDLVDIPVLSVTLEVVDILLDIDPTGSVEIITNTEIYESVTSNLIAETGGANDSIVIMGSHLDSVDQGPGLNDNGSGSAVNLAMALLFAHMDFKLQNKVRFCWWGAEEVGLVGSTFYVEELRKSGELKNIAANLNIDMLASPNGIRGVLNGTDAKNEDSKTGSIVIQHMFEKYLTESHLPYEIVYLSGRSDYGPFLDSGIPSGGVDTGAEGVKTPAQRTIFGGFAQAAYDPCYHQACDTIENINAKLMLELGSAVFDVLLELGKMKDLRQFLQTLPNNDEH